MKNLVQVHDGKEWVTFLVEDIVKNQDIAERLRRSICDQQYYWNVEQAERTIKKPNKNHIVVILENILGEKTE